MKAVIVCLFWIQVLNCLQRVLGQDAGDINYPAEIQMQLTSLKSTPGCDLKLMLPAIQLIFPFATFWTEICSPNFFDLCRDQFATQCVNVNCSQDDYMTWVDAFSKDGKDFTCSKTYDTVAGIAIFHDNMTCARTGGLEADSNLRSIGQQIWSGNSILCSDMESNIQRVTAALNQCTDKGILDLISNYFQVVVDASPCRGKIQINSASIFATNSLLFLTSIFLTWAISTTRL